MSEEEIIIEAKDIAKRGVDPNDGLELDDMQETMQNLLDLYNKLKADKNKLINYIAVRENKTYEEVCKEFEIGE